MIFAMANILMTVEYAHESGNEILPTVLFAAKDLMNFSICIGVLVLVILSFTLQKWEVVKSICSMPESFLWNCRCRKVQHFSRKTTF
ncbi:MAG: hypothetical protein L6W00_23400 [Lentisphaeria bacterium]|nr:MAG: hypothetical protein L6W00_23400 [Lentisphaeria bacterium]